MLELKIDTDKNQSSLATSGGALDIITHCAISTALLIRKVQEITNMDEEQAALLLVSMAQSIQEDITHKETQVIKYPKLDRFKDL